MTGDGTRHEVARADEIPPGERALVTIEGERVGVFNIEGTYYALSNRCCHDGGPVCEGEVYPLLEGAYESAGEMVDLGYSDEVYTITCPWHGWEYYLHTGEHIGSGDIQLDTYDVTVEDGTVFVRV